MMDLLSSPTFVQVLQAAGIGLLFLLAALGQWMGKKKETAPAESKDVMIPSVTVADRVALERLAETLRDAERVAREHREHDIEFLAELRELNRSNARIEGQLARIADKIK